MGSTEITQDAAAAAAEEQEQLPDLSRIVGSLEDLVRQGAISRERGSFARSKVEDLHKAILKSKGVRRKLTNDSLDLSTQLQAEIEILKKGMQLQAEEETTLDLLREDFETVENEALLCREREQSLHLEEIDLRRAQEEFQKKIKLIEEEHAAALAPQILQLKFDIEAVRKQIQEDAAKIEQYNKEVEATKQKLSEIVIESDQLQSQKKRNAEVLSGFDGVPEKLRKQGDALVNAVKGLHLQEQRQLDKIKDMENELFNNQNTRRNLGEDYTRSCLEVEKVRQYIEQKELSISELKKELEMASLEADQYLADRVSSQLPSTTIMNTNSYFRNFRTRVLNLDMYHPMLFWRKTRKRKPEHV